MQTKGQHVVPRGDRWAIRKAGSDRVTRYFETQDEAVRAAREIAQNQYTDLYVHGRDGLLRRRESYGRDAVRAKG